MPIQKKVNKNFFKKWTREMSYILGFFAADGYITVNKRGGEYWCIQITDKVLLENIKRIIQSNHKINIRLPYKGNENILYRIQLGSKEMCDDLRKLGFCERKTKSMVIPNIPNEYFPDFVRGYFDGDGNVWMGFVKKGKGTISLGISTGFTSCSYHFLKCLLERLKVANIENGSLFKLKTKQCYRLQFSIFSSLKLYNLMYNRGTIDLNGLFLDRKKKVFEKFIHLRP